MNVVYLSEISELPNAFMGHILLVQYICNLIVNLKQILPLYLIAHCLGLRSKKNNFTKLR